VHMAAGTGAYGCGHGLRFCNPHPTRTRDAGMAGFHAIAGLYYSRVILIFSVLNYVFAQFLKLFFHLCHTVTEPNGCASRAYTFASPLPLPPPPQIHAW
jgi:hypothetical protein